MCGIAGILDSAGQLPGAELRRRAVALSDALVHRGPDAGGLWMDDRSGVALAHRRLSIVDLSPEGSQPMASVSGRFVLTFNGEIYNYQDLRSELVARGHAFRGHSDTEVMLAAFEAWGIRSAVERFNGMFAFAVWDKQERELHLYRDRLGEKPLYYTWVAGAFLFGSELKSFCSYPGFDREVDPRSVATFLRHGYISWPNSIYRGVKKLGAGHGLVIRHLSAPFSDASFEYWSASDAIVRAKADPWRGSEADARAELEHLLKDSVRIRMQADVPLGAFLSGGVDSSLVVALMQAQSGSAVKTFTIGFNEEGLNEATFAKKVAAHLQTDHSEFYVTGEDALQVIPRLPQLYDEPFADSSQIPTFLVSRLARSRVTVSLSGDGGDELFGGYTRYLVADSIHRRLRLIPSGLKRITSRGLAHLDADTFARLYTGASFALPKSLRMGDPRRRLEAVRAILETQSDADLYRQVVSHWRDSEAVVRDGGGGYPFLPPELRVPDGLSFTEFMMFADSITYLPGDILAKVDRATMGVSLEGRMPLLDHRLFEFVWRLPVSMKIRGGVGKAPLRDTLFKYVPRELIERPKQGFAIPVAAWLRGPLKEWARDLLAPERLRREGFFSPEAIQQKLDEHITGKANWEALLWDALMFQSWHDTYVSARPGARPDASAA